MVLNDSQITHLRIYEVNDDMTIPPKKKDPDSYGQLTHHRASTEDVTDLMRLATVPTQKDRTRRHIDMT